MSREAVLLVYSLGEFKQQRYPVVTLENLPEGAGLKRPAGERPAHSPMRAMEGGGAGAELVEVSVKEFAVEENVKGCEGAWPSCDVKGADVGSSKAPLVVVKEAGLAPDLSRREVGQEAPEGAWPADAVDAGGVVVGAAPPRAGRKEAGLAPDLSRREGGQERPERVRPAVSANAGGVAIGETPPRGRRKEAELAPDLSCREVGREVPEGARPSGVSEEGGVAVGVAPLCEGKGAGVGA